MVVAGLLAGCFESHEKTCDDGTICPSTKECSSIGCVDPVQLAVCAGAPDTTDCAIPNVGHGRCQSGVCVLQGCGDGTVEVGEVCDDGNTVSGDGCRGDCQKIEVCGDGLLDEGEACDDGNTNPNDGCDACKATSWSAVAIVGGGIDPKTVGLTSPSGLAVDRSGNIFISDTGSHRIRRIDHDSHGITTVAGTGTSGYSGDGGSATDAKVDNPQGLAVDGLGNLYIADQLNHCIRRVDAETGTITTVAGRCQVQCTTFSACGDGNLATAALLADPFGVAVDGLGRLYIADTLDERIRAVDPVTGVITTIAGNGTTTASGDNIAATASGFDLPMAVALGPNGDFYISDSNHNRIRYVSAAGMITTVTTAGQVNHPTGLALDASGRLVIADGGDELVRRLDAVGVVTTIAGNGASGYSGDGGAATSASLANPTAVASDAQGTIYIADTSNYRVRGVDSATSTIATIAGTNRAGFTGDGGPATAAFVGTPAHVAIDAAGNVYVAETNTEVVRRIDAVTHVITTVAGTGVTGTSADGLLATESLVDTPQGVAIDAAGNLFIADTGNNRIRRVDALTGIMTTVAGGGASLGDGGPATSAQLFGPAAVAVDGSGTLFIADSSNHRIRRVDGTTHVITTIAGTGTAGFSDGTPATSKQLNFPQDVAVDAAGNVFVADSANHRIRKIAGTAISTVVGTGTGGFADGPVATAEIYNPNGVAVDAAGNIYVGDSSNHRIRMASAGSVSTIAGTGTLGFSGDGGPATNAQLFAPEGVSLDAAGNIYVADSANVAVRRIDATTHDIVTIAARIDPEGVGPVARAALASPSAVALAPAYTLFAGGPSGTLEALGATDLRVVAGRYPQNTDTGTLARFRDRLVGTIGGVAFDAATSTIYFTDRDASKLYAVDAHATDPATWTLSMIPVSPGLRGPTGLYFDATAGALYIADTGNHVIRRLAVSGGAVTTVAGVMQTLGFAGDGGLATAALLYRPQAITICRGDVFIADTGNQRVRRVSGGQITTVLGDGTPASSGEGSPANAFPVDNPAGLACDEFGNVFVTSSNSVRVVAANAAGVVDGMGGVTTIYGKAPRLHFPQTVTRCLSGIAVVDASTVQVTDSCTGLLIQIAR